MYLNCEFTDSTSSHSGGPSVLYVVVCCVRVIRRIREEDYFNLPKSTRCPVGVSRELPKSRVIVCLSSPRYAKQIFFNTSSPDEDRLTCPHILICLWQLISQSPVKHEHIFLITFNHDLVFIFICQSLLLSLWRPTCVAVQMESQSTVRNTKRGPWALQFAYRTTICTSKIKTKLPVSLWGRHRLATLASPKPKK